MAQKYVRKLKKLTSLLLTAALFLCSYESLWTCATAEGENSAETAEVSEIPSGDELYAEVTAPPEEERSAEEELYIAEENDAQTDYAAGAETAGTEEVIEEAEDVAEETDPIYGTEVIPEEEYAEEAEEPAQTPEERESITGGISLFASATPTPRPTARPITDEDRDYYNSKNEYAINTVDDWLQIDALSKEYNFEGKTINVMTPTGGGDVHYIDDTIFSGFGDADTPFAGTIKTAIAGISVETSCPLISYMSSKAVIEQFRLKMTGGNAGVAGTLVFEGDADTEMLLKGITVTEGYLDGGDEEGVGGLFGTVINNTAYKLTINAATVSDSETDQWGGINMTFTEPSEGAPAVTGKNVGTFIGKIEGNVTFIVNEDFHISVPSLYGTESTGSVVGKMEYSEPIMADSVYSELLANITGDTTATYPVLYFKEWAGFSAKNIKGTGYSGGVVGYADHAVITNATTSSVLEITDAAIEGGKAAGGFIGYAAYTTIDGPADMGEIKVNNSTFTCSLTNETNAVGVAGGFIGIYGDGNDFFNNIKMTIENLNFTTADYSGESASLPAKYLGGFVGKYDSADDIVITSESAPITINNIHFKVKSYNAYCGGFVSYVSQDAGSIKIDTELFISNIYLYIPSDAAYNNFATEAFGGISGIIESDGLEIKNIEISGLYAQAGRYIGAVAGKIIGANSSFDNIKITSMTLSASIDGISVKSLNNSYRCIYAAGALVGDLSANTEISNITVSDIAFSPYLNSGTSDNPTDAKRGMGGLIGVLGDTPDAPVIDTGQNDYTADTIENISISGTFKFSIYGSGGSYTREYSSGLIGYVRPKTAVQLDGTIDITGITEFTANIYTARLVGAQREALIYMQPTCAVYYGEPFAEMDEICHYGGIYRNETFWDDENIGAESVSSSEGTPLIERDPTTESGIKINGTVEKSGEGWNLRTFGDYIRFTIVNTTAGNYGMETFGTDNYDDISGGTFTVMNDIDLSARYSGIVTLNRNDVYYSNSTGVYYNSSEKKYYRYFDFSKYMFRGTFKGADSENVPTITLPGFPIYRQCNIGLFSSVLGATFKDLRITGVLDATRIYLSGNVSQHACGALAANAYNAVNVENVRIDGVTINAYAYNNSYSGDVYCGGLFGDMGYFTRTDFSRYGSYYYEGYDYVAASWDANGNVSAATYTWEADIKNVSVTNLTVTANSTDRAVIYSGGLLGRLCYSDSGTYMTVNFDNIDIQNETVVDTVVAGSTNMSYMAGFISYIKGQNGRALKCNFNDVLLDNVGITADKSNMRGGILGYLWQYADVKFTFTDNTDTVVVKNSSFNNVRTSSASVAFGAMLYELRYSVLEAANGFTVDGVTVSAPNINGGECSLFVSQALNSMIFLTDYSVVNTSVAFGGVMFDEVAGKTKSNSYYQNPDEYGFGIVSLSDTDDPYSLKKEDFHTYEYQADYTGCPNLANPHYNIYTRYYYNIPEIMEKLKADPLKLSTETYDNATYRIAEADTPEKLMMWHLLAAAPYNSGNNSYMIGYFDGCLDGSDISLNTGYTANVKNISLKIDGEIDMTGMSFYPTYVSTNQIIVGANYDNESSAEGLDKIIFDYDNINACENRSLAAGKSCVPMRSGSVVSGFFDSSQHSMLHTGLCLTSSSAYVPSYIMGLAFGGSVGTVRYSADAVYSGALFGGIVLNNSITRQVIIKDIVLDGLYVVNPDEDYDSGKDEGSLDNWQNYYGLLVGGWESTYLLITFDTILMKNYDTFVSKYPNKKAASALIGKVGVATSDGLKKFEFKNMSIADAEETSVLTENGTDLEKIHATSADQVMAFASYVYSYNYQKAEQGVYNFDDVEYFYGNGQFTPSSGKEYYITLGKELGSDDGTTKTEYYNTSSKVGTASYDSAKAAEDSDYIDFEETGGTVEPNYWLEFSNLNYKPYIYNYGVRNINVNYKSGDLLEGCGTYDDPYIISNERQLYSLYCYLAAGGSRYTSTYDISGNIKYESNVYYYPQYNSSYKLKLNEWKVNIPGREDAICGGEHEYLTYDYAENPVTGFDDTAYPNATYRKDGRDSRITVNMLRNAYYKIVSDIDMSDYDDFYGLGKIDTAISTVISGGAYYPFTGVIIGEKEDGGKPVIKMPKFTKFTGTYSNMLTYLNTYGFVASAKGCALKNLEIQYPEDSLAKIGNTTSAGGYVFGGIIGTIWGGDNIIDDVTVTGSIMTNIASVNSGTLCRQYMGAMVGHIRGGGLILRNFSTDDFADFNFNMTGTANNLSATPKPDTTLSGELNSAGAEYQYINGTIGRVTNGYALVESVDDPEKNVDNDGDKLTRLDTSGPTIDFSDYDENTTNKLPASQSYSLINGAYYDGAEKIKITRNGYNFDCDVSDAKQLMLYSLAMNSGGFYTCCSNTYTLANGAFGNLTHVYWCGGSSIDSSSFKSAYDVYARCRKAKYDAVGNCTADTEDYKYARDYDQLNTAPYHITDKSELDENSYKNYLGYNYLISKYFEFYEGAVKDEFWIMRRPGTCNAITDYSVWFNIFNCHDIRTTSTYYYRPDTYYYIGQTNLNFAQNGYYDMSPYTECFRGIGAPFSDSETGVYYYTNATFNGNLYGNGATVKLDMRSRFGSDYAGLFNYIQSKTIASYIYNSVEYVCMYEMRDLTLTGTVENINTNYLAGGASAGMLAASIDYGRYALSNINIKDARIAGYSYIGGMAGQTGSNAQIVADNCRIEDITVSNKPLDYDRYNSSNYHYTGGMFGYLKTLNSTVNSSYITSCAMSGVDIDTYSASREFYAGGMAGYISSSCLSVYDADINNINITHKTTSGYLISGGLAGYSNSNTSLELKNISVSDITMDTRVQSYYAKLGGGFGHINCDNVYAENVSIKNIFVTAGTVKITSYYYSASGGYFGGFAAYINNSQIDVNGIYIDGLKTRESELTVTTETVDANGQYTKVNAECTQNLTYAGGFAGYENQNVSYAKSIRIGALTEENITSTPTPSPTCAPQSDTGEAFARPTAAPNPNKGVRNYIKNSDIMGRYSGGFIGCTYHYASLSYTSSTGVSNNKTIDWLISDLDIIDNKILSPYFYRSSYNMNNIKADANYSSAAGGMIGYLYRMCRSDLYANNVNIEHNVIGTMNNYAARSCSGGVYGNVTEGENTDTYSGRSHYYYNTTLKNNYIGPLDIVKNEEQYYTARNVDSAYRMFLAQHAAFNDVRTAPIDELGTYSRLFTDGEMTSSDTWDYEVNQAGDGEWYAQDNLYRYSKNVGTFAGYESQTQTKRINLFFVSPNVIYDNSQYSYTDEDGNEVTSTAAAHRPAFDVGSKSVLTAEDDPYEYREYTHIIYDDANEPTKYGEWESTAADYVVPQALGYADNNDYLFAQLRNIYSGYKAQIQPSYIETAEYDETVSLYRLKDNYRQDENGYTMDEVYDYIYYGYERDANGNQISDTTSYMSTYKDKDGKTVPMLVYKAQYGTPDTLINSIINILTNNAGAYNSETGYFNEGVPCILDVQSWKMEMTDGVASPVMNADGTHKQGGFSVTYTDGDPNPVPSNTSSPRPWERDFTLRHTSYDDQRDEKNGTFTVLHITYGWDNSNMTLGGYGLNSQNVMTLDIPVYVSKLLEVQINMRTLSGVQLSGNNMFEHGSAAGTVVLKKTNTVMAEYVYDYPRTTYDAVYLKKKLSFEISTGNMYLYKDTKITLIDVTDNDKEYYYYVDKTTVNPQIPFEAFVDADGVNYQTRDLSDTEQYPILGTEHNIYTDLRGQKWGGSPQDSGYISNYGVGVEKFLIIIDKSATQIDENDTSAYAYHSIHVRVDDENTDPVLMERIRYDGKNYTDTPENTPTDEYPNPDWYGGEVNGYTAYNYVTIREIDDVKATLPSGATEGFDGAVEEDIGIGKGKVVKASVDYSLTASVIYWTETHKTATDQYLDFVISIQSDNKYAALPVGTKYSFDGSEWFTIGKGMDYEYGKKQIYYYADRAKKDIDAGGDGEAYKFLINQLEGDYSGTIDIYFDFRECSDAAFSDGNYYIQVDAYKTTRREYPVSGDYQDSWLGDVYAIYNEGNIGFALQEDDLLYRGINRYLPKVSDNGNIDFKGQLDFRKYLDEDTNQIKDVVANQYYTIVIKAFRKEEDGQYQEYNDIDRLSIYYDKPKYDEASGEYVYDGVVDDDDPLIYGYDESSGMNVGGVSYKFTKDQLNAGSSIGGVSELAFKLKYNTDELTEYDFSNYKFEAYLCMSEDPVTDEAIPDGSAAAVDAAAAQMVMNNTEPISDYLIFTVARLKTD